MTQHERPLCRCGHGRDAHEHLRRGADCALCGRAGCAAFRTTARRWAALSWSRRRMPATVEEPPLATVIAFPQRELPVRRSA